MKTLRVFFEKTGRAAYISHLDLSRTMQRAVKRAGLPVWYTEGFNPHIYLTFALPLSLGYQGYCESMDLRVIEDIAEEVFVQKLNAALPDGLRALSVAEPQMKPERICFARYCMTFEIAGQVSPEAALKAFLEQPAIEVRKKSKKGEMIVDIKPDVQVEDYAVDGYTITMTLVLPAGGQKNFNPSLVIAGLTDYVELDVPVRGISRLSIMDEKMHDFA